MTIQISKEFADGCNAIQEQIRNLTQLQQVIIPARIQGIAAAEKILTDAKLRELGHDPDQFDGYTLSERDGNWFMQLTAKPAEPPPQE
jgi:hypothetical protein